MLLNKAVSLLVSICVEPSQTHNTGMVPGIFQYCTQHLFLSFHSNQLIHLYPIHTLQLSQRNTQGFGIILYHCQMLTTEK